MADEVVGALRHDLKNRLTSVRNGAYYLRKRLSGTELAATDARLLPFIGIIDSESETAGKMLDGGARAVVHVAPQSARFAIDDATGDAVAWIRCGLRSGDAASKDASAQHRAADLPPIELDLAPAEVFADRPEITLAVRALLENAVEAGATSVRVTSAIELGVYRLTVRDDGPGISEDRVEEAFQPFFSTKPGHLGVGLAIARRIARRHRGDLRWDPNGSGAGLTLSLPLA